MKEKEVKHNVLKNSLEDIMADRFARYSKYIIQERALPDARDGLSQYKDVFYMRCMKMGILTISHIINPQKQSVTSLVIITLMGIALYMMRWFVCHKIGRLLIL